MRCTRLIPLAALVAVALASSHAAAQNLLTDPSFEDPSKYTSDGAPFVGSWEGFNGGAGTFSVNDTLGPRTGQRNSHLGITGANNSFAGFFQEVGGLAAGQSITYSGWNKLGAGVFDIGAEFRIEWRNSVSNTDLGATPNLIPPLTTDYTQFSRTEVVPAGADSARAVYAIQSFGDGGTNTGAVFVDDISVSVVPEPSTVALLAVAAAAGFGLRRRRA